ncbi:hypothetical protein M5689_006340 [Euphorbia peplus]|nr:hypothetical protein M5689_006340 [Euphorbia peplus]
MILEALSTIKDKNGCHFNAILFTLLFTSSRGKAKSFASATTKKGRVLHPFRKEQKHVELVIGSGVQRPESNKMHFESFKVSVGFSCLFLPRTEAKTIQGQVRV